MMKYADISIGFGGVKEIAKNVLAIADKTFYTEGELVSFLSTLL